MESEKVFFVRSIDQKLDVTADAAATNHGERRENGGKYRVLHSLFTKLFEENFHLILRQRSHFTRAVTNANRLVSPNQEQ